MDCRSILVLIWLFLRESDENSTKISEISKLNLLEQIMKRVHLFLMLLLLQFNFSCKKNEPINLKIMTFNVRYGTAKDGENSWEHRNSILLNCLKKYPPDILGTQESLSFQIDSILAVFPQYKTFGVGRYHGVSEPERPHESMSGESCNILYDSTKFAVIDSGTYWHSDTPDIPASRTWGNSLPRITTWGRYQDKRSGNQFVVMNTHFHWQEPYVSETTKLILRKWREIAGDTPMILMGDFNLDPTSETHQLFCRETGAEDVRGNFIDCWQALGKSETDAATSHSFKGGTSQHRIDWILVTPEFKPEKIDIIYYQENDRYPSDHYPVLADIQCP